jgi:hypothetical protein
MFMASRPSMPSTPKLDQKKLFDLTKSAVDQWFLQTGTIKKPEKINLDRTLTSYRMGAPHFAKLTEHVIDVVQDKAGISLNLKPARLKGIVPTRVTVGDYLNGSVFRIQNALDGNPVTPPPEGWDPFEQKKTARPVSPPKPAARPKRPAKRRAGTAIRKR